MRHLILLMALPCFGSDLAARINPIATKCRGDVSLYVKNLDTGETFGIRETERVRTASHDQAADPRRSLRRGGGEQRQIDG